MYAFRIFDRENEGQASNNVVIALTSGRRRRRLAVLPSVATVVPRSACSTFRRHPDVVVVASPIGYPRS